MTLVAPMPYFGGKSAIAPLVWERLGDVPNYVEAFFGSGAVLLARPDSHTWWERIETVNDSDGMVSNFWRALQSDPDAVAHHADHPVNENDLHARHAWLVGERENITRRLEGSADYYDAKAAGWWLWGICSWIGSGWCAGVGPWHVVDGELVSTRDDGSGTWRQLPHLGDAGRGIKRQLPHLGSAGQGINRQLPHLGNAGRGINRKRPHLGNAGQGQCETWSEHLRETMAALADRLRRVRVCCGDWSRVCGPTPTEKQGLTGVFLDAPYLQHDRDAGLYSVDSTSVADDVQRWAVSHGDNPLLRIAMCAYDGHYVMPGNWTFVRWKAHGGYGSQGEGRGRENSTREIVWFSPHCLSQEKQQLSMFPPL